MAPDGPATTATSALACVPSGRYVLFVVAAAVGLSVDLATKHYFFAQPDLRGGAIWWQWKGHAGIQLSLNEGALFGMGQGNVWIFATMSCLAAVAIPTWLFVFRAARDAWLTIALGFVMAGVLGNLYDRLGLHGEIWPAGAPRAGETVHAVRDWVLWQVSDHWRWPNFNIADSLLVVGAGMLFLHALLQPQAPKAAAA